MDLPDRGLRPTGTKAATRAARPLHGAESYHAGCGPRGLDPDFTSFRSSAEAPVPKTSDMTTATGISGKAALATRWTDTWTGWGFVLCTAVTIGYGLWTLYGSGTRIVFLDLIKESRTGRPSSSAVPSPDIGPVDIPLGPIGLAREMSPLRAILRAAYAPVGSTRIPYEISIVDDANQPVLEAKGAFGSSDDHASMVRSKTSLGDFRLNRARAYFVRVRTAPGSKDDLRVATLELRSNVLPVDARIPWGFGLVALACLIANLVAMRGRALPAPIDQVETETRKAA